MELKEPHPFVTARSSEAAVQFRDPLSRMGGYDLALACNSVGRDVTVGEHVVLWGGKSASCTGIVLGDRVRLYDHCRLVLDQLSPQSGIKIGDGAALNFACYIDGSGGVSIGKRVAIGPNLMLVSSQHRIDPDKDIGSSGKALAPVTIGDDVWIGGNVCILAGVTIGHGAVVGAGSVVTRDVPARTVVIGNPAKPLRKIRAGFIGRIRKLMKA